MSLSHSIRIFGSEIPLALVIFVLIGIYGLIFAIVRASKERRRSYIEKVESSSLLESSDSMPIRKYRHQTDPLDKSWNRENAPATGARTEDEKKRPNSNQ